MEKKTLIEKSGLKMKEGKKMEEGDLVHFRGWQKQLVNGQKIKIFFFCKIPRKTQSLTKT